MHLENLTITSFKKGLEEKKFSIEEVTKEYLDTIETQDAFLNAYLSVFKEEALQSAKEADILNKGKKKNPPLLGVPVAIKDNLLMEGKRTTAASKILESYSGSYDATVIKKLKEAGCIFLGKTNMDEFAMGASTENSAFKTTKNPFDSERVPGGSSGGSAAAVAANLALGALGSDTGGSVRQPAAFCGAVGLKPTYGAVSRFGLIAMASSLDQIGPIAKTVEDAEFLFNAIRGEDILDSTSVDFDFSPFKTSQKELKQLKIGIPKEYFMQGIDPEVEKGFEEARKKIEALGFKTKEISLPHTKYALSAYYIIMPAEVSTNLARFDGIRYLGIPSVEASAKTLKEIYLKTKGEGLGRETRRRVLLGTFVLSAGYYDAYYTKAQKVRKLIKGDFDAAFDSGGGDVDVILAPSTPTPAFKIGEKIEDPIAMYLSDVFTVPANLAGLPAISIPVRKYSKEKKELPIGFQLIGKHFHEADILGIGKLYEEE
jgi:aspartyl-tRNA(Asn)/glutamyl-tRNA(Gln) amidotransferase subunit A